MSFLPIPTTSSWRCGCDGPTGPLVPVVAQPSRTKQIERIGGLELARSTLIHLTDIKPTSKICTG